jgi:phage/plasmid-associated DNA primase
MRIAKLYANTSNLTMNAKLNIISNYDPNLDIDEGIKRRALVMRFTNKFLNSDDWAKYEKLNKLGKGVYHAKKNLREIIDMPQFKLAMFHLMEKYLKIYNKNGINNTTEYQANFEEVAEENDYISNFINNYYVFRNYNNADEDDAQFKVSKNDFYKLYKQVSDHNVIWNKLLSDIKRVEGIKYFGTHTIGGIKGVISGIKRRPITNDYEYKSDNITEASINEDEDEDVKIDVPIIKKEIKKIIIDEVAEAYEQGCEKIVKKIELETVIVDMDNKNEDEDDSDPYQLTL